MEDAPNYASFPQTEYILDNKARAECEALFEELEVLQASIDVQQDRAEEIKRQLDRYQFMVDGPGIRYGQLTYSVADLKGRRSLSEALLMGNGVTKDVIDASYKAGKPYQRRTFKRIEEKEKPPEV
jgi:hypothetical protein